MLLNAVMKIYKEFANFLSVYTLVFVIIISELIYIKLYNMSTLQFWEVIALLLFHN